MFVEAARSERVPVKLGKEKIEAAIFDVLRNRLPNTPSTAHGTLLFPVAIESISDAEVHEGVIYPLVNYRFISYRLYPGEIVTGTVEKQDSTGVFLAHPLISSLFVPSSQLPSPSELKTVPSRNNRPVEMWVWKYEGSSLYVKMSEVFRVKILKIESPSVVYCTACEPGLGAVSWW